MSAPFKIPTPRARSRPQESKEDILFFHQKTDAQVVRCAFFNDCQKNGTFRHDQEDCLTDAPRTRPFDDPDDPLRSSTHTLPCRCRPHWYILGMAPWPYRPVPLTT